MEALRWSRSAPAPFEPDPGSGHVALGRRRDGVVLTDDATNKVDLESIVRSLVPAGETLLWMGESDKNLLRRRNWTGLRSLLVRIPVAFVVAAALIALAVYMMGLLPANGFGRAVEAIILILALLSALIPVLWAFFHAIRLGLGDSLGARAVVTGITDQRIIVAMGAGTMHQRICTRGGFQQMTITPIKDDVASFSLFSSSKNVPDLHIRYVRPAEQIAQLLQSQLASNAIDAEQNIAGGTSP